MKTSLGLINPNVLMSGIKNPAVVGGVTAIVGAFTGLASYSSFAALSSTKSGWRKTGLVAGGIVTGLVTVDALLTLLVLASGRPSYEV